MTSVGGEFSFSSFDIGYCLRTKNDEFHWIESIDETKKRREEMEWKKKESES